VDALFSRFDLTLDDHYRQFLAAQAAAYIPVESALDRSRAAAVLPDWERRRRADLLRSDLRDLDADYESLPTPVFANPAAVLGAIYVLEGSRLGGAMLKRGLRPDLPARFLGAAGEPGAWRRLAARLDDGLAEPDMLDAATGAAREVFGLFELAGQHRV
jgi:heme oxygenase